MNPCPNCDGFSQRINIHDLHEYQDIVRQLIEVVNKGTFFLAHASGPLEDMFKTPMPGDIIFHDFQCLMCGRKFKLFADTYHGKASWTAGELPKPIEEKPN